MTTTLPPEAHLLVVLGEVRGDVKGILRTQNDMNVELKALESRLGDRLNKELQALDDATKASISGLNTRVGSLDTRVTSLEGYRIKIAGVTIGAAILIGLTKDKLPALATFVFGG